MSDDETAAETSWGAAILGKPAQPIWVTIRDGSGRIVHDGPIREMPPVVLPPGEYHFRYSSGDAGLPRG